MIRLLHRKLDPGTDAWCEVRDKPLPQVKVTERARKIALTMPHLFRGCMRVVMGKFWTDAEYEERRRRILNTPLP